MIDRFFDAVARLVKFVEIQCTSVNANPRAKLRKSDRTVGWYGCVSGQLSSSKKMYGISTKLQRAVD